MATQKRIKYAAKNQQANYVVIKSISDKTKMNSEIVIDLKITKNTVTDNYKRIIDFIVFG